MATFLAPATGAGGPDAARLAFIAGHLVPVRVGWFLWETATLSLVATFVTVARSLEGESTAGLRVLAVAAVALGAIPDSINNLINAAILPDIARAWTVAPEAARAAIELDFHLWDRAAVILTGTLANALYAAGGWMILGASRRVPEYPRSLRALQIPLWTATSLMAVAAAADSLRGLVVTVAVTMTFFVLWGYGTAWKWLGR